VQNARDLFVGEPFAGELFISVSTVEAHLTRIYRKLGLRRRTELSTWFGSGR